MDATLPEQLSPETPAPEWHIATRVVFRFCFVYFSLYSLSAQIITSFVPVPNFDVPDPSSFWPIRPMVFWTAAHIFRVQKPLVYTGSGSGDKVFDWVLLFCMLVVSVVATVIWSVLDRRRPHYITLHKWFRLFIRFALACQMMLYGMDKAVPLQMPFPSLTRLLEPYGDFSPMGVLWASIGASTAYEIFAGCAELLGGVLLIFPRTTLLGALISLADIIQVFMLNMTYDVPVKLLSFHLILLAFFVLAPDFHRLGNVFFFNRAAAPSANPPLFTSFRGNRLAFFAQVTLGVWLLGMNAYSSRVSWFQYGGGRALSPLYGIWDVDQQSIDGQIRPPLLTDSARWRRAIFDSPTRMAFQGLDDSFVYRPVSIDVNSKTLVLADSKDKNWKANFTFARPAPDQLTLDGSMDGHSIHLQLKLVDRKKFHLVSRGFHWIQDYPYNQ